MAEKRVLPQVDTENCSLCGLCAEACACGAVSIGDKGPVFDCPDVRAGETSGACTCMCEEVCPSGAIAVGFEIVEQEGETQPADEDKDEAGRSHKR